MNPYRISASLPQLKACLDATNPGLDKIITRASEANPWFLPEFIRLAIDAIKGAWLDSDTFEQWISRYGHHHGDEKTIALIMAGNIPLAGFHDLLCVLAAGHRAQIKLSEKDAKLLPWIVDQWAMYLPELRDAVTFVDKVSGYDAVIATGSNNSARYFEYYFRDKPHILRKNRNAVGVLNGDESPEQLRALADDIFLYFGLGCRNVSKIYVPAGYDFTWWPEAMAGWSYLADHFKYKNNLDYNIAIYLINQIPHVNLGQLIIKADDAFASRIGCLHYAEYDSIDLVITELDMYREDIQCVISTRPIEGWPHVKPGQGQYPQLDQYADGVDTMQFLLNV